MLCPSFAVLALALGSIHHYAPASNTSGHRFQPQAFATNAAHQLGVPSRDTNGLFLFHGGPPALSTLDPYITVNGVTVQASVWCQGSGATSSSWACTGQTLTAAGSGGSFLTTSPLGSESAVNGAGTRYYTGGVFNPGANDVIIEAILRQTVTDTVTPLSTWTAGNQGFELRSVTASAAIQVLVGGATTTATIASTTNIDDHYYHILCVIDRSGSGQLYINGKASGSAVAVSGVGAITGGPLTLLGRVGGTRLFDDRVVHLAAWAHSDVGSHSQDQVARDRAARAYGITAGLNSGFSRGSPAKVEIAGSLHQVGSHWMRSETPGFLGEVSTTNLALRSEDLSTSWTKNDAGDTIGGTVTTPLEGTSTTSGIIGDSTDGNHGVSQAITVTAVIHTFSAYFKTGTQTWARLLNATTGSSLYCNIGAGTLGTSASVENAWIERLGSTDWYRCGFAFTGTAAAHTFHVRVAQADSDDSVAGNGSAVQLYAWGVQVDAQPALSSYITTAGSTVGRTADTLRYSVTEFDIDTFGVSIVADINRGSVGANGVSGLVRLSDGASNNDRVNLVLTTANSAPRVLVTAASVSQADFSGNTFTGTGDLFSLAVFAKTNSVKLFVNGSSEGTPDTSATMPDDLDTVDIDADYSAHVSGVGIYRGEVRR